MDNLKINYFANDTYKILKLLHDNLVTVKGDLFAPLTQQDIADLAKFSKVKTNHLLKDLISKGFVDSYKSTRGKYILTNEGDKIISIMEKKIWQ